METSPFPRRSKIAKAGVCEASLSSFQPQFGGGVGGGEGMSVAEEEGGAV